jgi:imidazolonepropionase-like amidohydrolase
MGKTRYILMGRFIDGGSADVRRNMYLAVENGIITAIGSGLDLPSNDKTIIDDFSHCTILPALVDCSVSLSQSPAMNDSEGFSTKESSSSEKSIMLERHVHYCHSHGVQGVADNGNTERQSHRQNEKEQEYIIHIRTSGRRFRRGEQDCAANHPATTDFLKISYCHDISISHPFEALLSQEELHHMLQYKGDKKTVVIANGRQQIEEALEAGCDAIEQGYDMAEDTLREMAKRNVLWIPSVIRAKNALDGAGTGGDVCCRFSLRYVAPGKAIPGAEAFWKKILARQLATLRLARKLGVKTALGTGAGSLGILHGESMVEEMKLFIKAGYSLEEAIQCASENGARFFDMEQLGMLTVGKHATFLISRGTAKQLPRKLSYLEGIYIDGRPSRTYRKI